MSISKQKALIAWRAAEGHALVVALIDTLAYTQVDLAERTGIPRPYISNVYNDKNNVLRDHDIKALKKIFQESGKAWNSLKRPA